MIVLAEVLAVAAARDGVRVCAHGALSLCVRCGGVELLWQSAFVLYARSSTGVGVLL